MRKSRVLLAGVAVAAAAAATSAFTNSNTVPPSVAGYGQGAVTGAVVTNTHYVANTADPTILDSVVFTTSTHLTGTYTATLTFRTGVDPADGTGGTVIAPTTGYACVETTAWAAGSMQLTCDTTPALANGNVTRHFTDYDGIGLSVVS
jgi:hypothetical protein